MAASANLWFREDSQFHSIRKPMLNHFQNYFWMRLENQCSKFKFEFRFHSFHSLGPGTWIPKSSCIRDLKCIRMVEQPLSWVNSVEALTLWTSEDVLIRVMHPVLQVPNGWLTPYFRLALSQYSCLQKIRPIILLICRQIISEPDRLYSEITWML